MNPELLGEARQQAHYAALWLDRISRSYVPARPDDSHLGLTWSFNDQAMLTQYLPNNSAFGLVLSELVIFCVHPDGYSQEIILDGKSDSDIKEWIGDQLDNMGLSPDELEKKLPYSLEGLAPEDDAAYDTIDTAISLQELSLWYDDAQKVLIHLARSITDRSVKLSNIIIRPQQFDISIQIHLRTTKPDYHPVIWIGMSPGDKNYNQPYFYVTPWPFLMPFSLPELPLLGHWHMQGYVGAVALGSRIIEHEYRERVLFNFLKEAVAIGQHRLSI